MEYAQRELVCALLDRIRSLGLISDLTCDRAVALARSANSFPEFFRRPEHSTEEVGGHERAPGAP